MKLPFTLSVYISRQFLASFLMVLGIFAMLVFMIDTLELLRKVSSKDVSIFTVLNMGFLKMPLSIQMIMPFIILISTVLAYTKLSRTHELVVIRAAGVSVWEFMLPSVLMAFFIGAFIVTVFNPIGCALLSKYERMDAKYIQNKTKFLEISDGGVWLRQRNFEKKDSGEDISIGETIIHAKTISGESNIVLNTVVVLDFSQDDKFLQRIDAESAELQEGKIKLNKVILSYPDSTSTTLTEYTISTSVTQDDLQKSFSDPQTISFWQLGSFIAELEERGFSSIAHRMHRHKILSSPIFYSAMVFIAGIFSLSNPRQGKIGLLITSSIIVGFLIYFVSNLLSSFGLSGSMPVIISAWVPVMITLLAGVGFLLHLEDG
jgi:lipopolysaccharide export system permease protein